MDGIEIRKLAKLYSEGNSLEIDKKEFCGYLMDVSNSEDLFVKRALGLLYFRGDGVAQDYLQAYSWFCVAALQGDAISQNYLGDMYENGYGIHQNDKKALEWYLKAVQSNNSEIMINLGNYYFKKGEDDSAFRWFEKAAELDNAGAAFELACCYFGGTGIEANEEEAEKWFVKSAENGFHLGKEIVEIYEKYSEGKKNTKYFEIANRICKSSIKSNENKAIAFYKKAAEYGNVEAQAYLGDKYLHGDDYVKVDYVEALKYLNVAAKGGNVRAKNALGYMYAYGYGVRKNIRKAHLLFKRAAEGGDVEAMVNVALSYEDGIGTSPNKEKSLMWYKEAEKNGEKKVSSEVRRLEREVAVMNNKNRKVRQGGGSNLVFRILVGLGVTVWFAIAVRDKNFYYVISALGVYLCSVIIPYIIYLIYGAKESIKIQRNTGIMIILYIIEMLGFTIFYVLLKNNIIEINENAGIFQYNGWVIFGTFFVGMIILNIENWVCAKKVNMPIAPILLNLISMSLYSVLVCTILIEAIIGMMEIGLVIVVICMIVYGIGWFLCWW